MNNALGELTNMVPHIFQAVHRVVDGSWTNVRKVWDIHSFILIYDGEAVIGCNEERHVSRGDLIYFKPGDIRWGHTFEHNPMRCYGLDFKYSCLLLDGQDWFQKDVPLPIPSFLHIDDPNMFSRILHLFKSLTDEWISPRTFSKTLRERAFFMELLNLLSLWSNSKRTLNYDKLRKVEKVTQYILDHYAKKITLQDLADTIQLSRSYLQVIFKEVTGTSPIEYLINVRVNKAKELIKAGCDNIREVSELCGFNDSFYFSRMFKKIEGVSPSQYRDIVRSQNRFV